MMDANRKERAGKFVQQDPFRWSALLIIKKITTLRPAPPDEFVDECLHSIFFAGMINVTPYQPEDILFDYNGETLTRLKERFPLPFDLYRTQLPKRSPFSCVLDMFVHQIRREGNREDEEQRVIEQLQTFTKMLKDNGATKMIPSTICVSHSVSSPADRYYGLSMSTLNRVHGKIMVAVSCLYTWDSYVADAVMTFNPDKTKKSDFDGTLQLQELIRCEAFSIGQGAHMDPCRSCGNLFGLTTGNEQLWAYGNCAEAESISNLLKSEAEVRQRATPQSELYTPENRQRAKDSVLYHLRDLLIKTNFNGWRFDVYSP